MAAFLIRTPEEADLEDLAELHFYMWNKFYDFLPLAYSQQHYSMANCRNLQRQLLENCSQAPHQHKAWIARDCQNNLAGLCYVGKNKIHHYDLDIEGVDAELHRLYILPSCRGHGLGETFFTLAIEWAKENSLTTMFAWSFDRNPYRRFYLKRDVQIIKQMSRNYAGTSFDLTAYGWNTSDPDFKANYLTNPPGGLA